MHKYKPLTIRLLAGVLAISSVLTLAATSIQVFLEYRSDMSEFESVFDVVEKTNLPALAQATWRFNSEQVNESLQGIVQHQGIVKAMILDAETSEHLYTAGMATEGATVTRTFPIIYEIDGKENETGKLVLLGTLDHVYERLRQRIVTILVSQGVKTFFASFFILLFVNFLVVRRIKQIGTFLSLYDPRKKSSEILVKTRFFFRKSDDIDHLAEKIRAMVRSLDDLYDNLEARIASRTQDLVQKNADIRSILDNVRHGLLSVGVDGRILPEYSSATEAIFETKKIAGQDFVEFLCQDSDMNSHTQSQLTSGLVSTLGELIYAYEGNSWAFVNEISRRFPNGREKIIELDWEPVVDKENMVSRLLVTVRDVTQRRIEEEKAKKAGWEIELLEKFLTIGPQAAVGFCDRAIETVAVVLAAVSVPTAGEVAWGGVKRKLHTLKGNAGTTGFLELSSRVHELEETLSLVENQRMEIGKAVEVVEALDELLRSYRKFFYDKSGLDHTIVSEAVYSPALRRMDYNDEKQRGRIAAHLFRTFVDGTSTSLSKIVAPLVRQIDVICRKAGKPNVSAIINDPEKILFKEEFGQLLAEVASHCLLNTIEHGVEEEGERIALSKSPTGRFEMTVSSGGDKAVRLWIGDDGRGINLGRIRRLKGQGSTEGISDEEMVEFIFEAGSTTSTTVSEIAGRGIGMEAVRSSLEERGCKINVEFIGGHAGDEFRPFRFVVDIPSSEVYIPNAAIRDSLQVG